MNGNSIRGLQFHITSPATLASIVGATVAGLYIWKFLGVPQSAQTLFAVSLASVLFLAVVWGLWNSRRMLSALVKIEALSTPPERGLLTQALQQLSTSPEQVFRDTLVPWVVSTTAVALIYGQHPEVTTVAAVRVAFIGIAIGPLTAVLSELWVLTRCREAMARICAFGVTKAEVVAAIPPGASTFERRLVKFAVVSVFSPLTLLALAQTFRNEVLIDGLQHATSAVDRAAVFDSVAAGAWWPVAVVVILIFAVVLYSGVQLGRSVSEPLRDIAKAAGGLGEGKLGGTPLIPCEDESWAAFAALSDFEALLIEAILQLQAAGPRLAISAEQLLVSAERHEAGSAEQASALTETSAATEELARSAKQVSTNALQLADFAAETLTAAQEGKGAADGFYAALHKVRESNQDIADSVVKLNKRVQQVGRIVEFIDGIADKTDLLAVNAELEGTKAGDIGRGFSLVAAEMRRLSEGVMSSTREITRLIDEIRDATNAAVMATEAGVKATDAGSQLAQRVSETLKDILDFAALTADAVKSITLATGQQQTGTDQLAEAMGEILTATVSGANTAKEMASSNQTIGDLAVDLKQIADRFEVRA